MGDDGTSEVLNDEGSRRQGVLRAQGMSGAYVRTEGKRRGVGWKDVFDSALR
jgi:hypothetical protein